MKGRHFRSILMSVTDLFRNNALPHKDEQGACQGTLAVIPSFSRQNSDFMDDFLTPCPMLNKCRGPFNIFWQPRRTQKPETRESECLPGQNVSDIHAAFLILINQSSLSRPEVVAAQGSRPETIGGFVNKRPETACGVGALMTEGCDFYKIGGGNGLNSIFFTPSADP